MGTLTPTVFPVERCDRLLCSSRIDHWTRSVSSRGLIVLPRWAAVDPALEPAEPRSVHCIHCVRCSPLCWGRRRRFVRANPEQSGESSGCDSLPNGKVLSGASPGYDLLLILKLSPAPRSGAAGPWCFPVPAPGLQPSSRRPLSRFRRRTRTGELCPALARHDSVVEIEIEVGISPGPPTARRALAPSAAREPCWVCGFCCCCCCCQRRRRIGREFKVPPLARLCFDFGLRRRGGICRPSPPEEGPVDHGSLRRVSETQI